jgi:DNA-binding transcriptional LysR family regulator
MLHEIDLSRIDLNLLVLFEVVMAEGNVGRAAGRLNLSPSAVSHGLGRLRRLLNDPLFLRTQKGVVPTERALELAESVRTVLAGVRSVISRAAPFDPSTSQRAFTIGVPDGASSFFLPALLARLRAEAPGVDLRLRHLLPADGGRTAATAWNAALADLDNRTLDLAVGPFEAVPARFAVRKLRDEDFVIACRANHAFAGMPDLQTYCDAQHIVVSQTGDAYGFVDYSLEPLGHQRRIALTVPGFFMALSYAAATDLLVAVPRSFALAHAAAFALAIREPPLQLPRFELSAVLPKVALADMGLVWLRSMLAT